MEGVELWTEREYTRAYLSTEAAVATSQWVRPGSTWNGDPRYDRFPTFMKAIKGARPPPFPAGLQKSTEQMVAMWTQDQYRYPRYQYSP